MALTKWTIDPTHSEITFKVKHLMISTVTGTFNVFDGQAESETDDFKKVKDIHFKADVNSVNTNNKDRDDHLKSGDFFESEKYPEISFKADSFDASTEKVTGDLTIKGVTKQVTLDVELGGVVVDPYGQTKAGLTVSGKIKRKEFGLTWSPVTEAGSVVVSDDVRLNAEVQFTKQA